MVADFKRNLGVVAGVEAACSGRHIFVLASCLHKYRVSAIFWEEQIRTCARRADVSAGRVGGGQSTVSEDLPRTPL